MSLWVISDTRFCEERIVRLRNRPFEDVEEMNEVLIYRWNSKVKKEDKVFHLGNFGYEKIQELRKILQKLNGKITLIQGEEDRSFNKLLELDFVCLCHGIHLDYKDYHFYLTSNPSQEILYHGCSNFINLYGNVYPIGKIIGTKINMSCDYWDFSPVSFDDIIMEYKLNSKNTY